MKHGGFSLAGLIVVALMSCRSSETAASSSAGTSNSDEPASAREASPGGVDPRAGSAASAPAVRSAEAISAITKSLPLYPNAKSKGAPNWAPPGQFEPDKWGTSYEGDTPDPLEKVLDWYEKELPRHGWVGTRSFFKGMMTFENASAPGKLITLASGPDEKVPGQTLIRILVQDAQKD